MPDQNPVDQCPFCDAPWGECSHARLLAEWEADALAREAQWNQTGVEAPGERHERGQTKPGSAIVPAEAPGGSIQP